MGNWGIGIAQEKSTFVRTAALHASFGNEFDGGFRNGRWRGGNRFCGGGNGRCRHCGRAGIGDDWRGKGGGGLNGRFRGRWGRNGRFRRWRTGHHKQQKGKP